MRSNNNVIYLHGWISAHNVLQAMHLHNWKHVTYLPIPTQADTHKPAHLYPSTHLHTSLPTCIYTYISTYVTTYLPPYLPTHLLTIPSSCNNVLQTLISRPKAWLCTWVSVMLVAHHNVTIFYWHFTHSLQRINCTQSRKCSESKVLPTHLLGLHQWCSAHDEACSLPVHPKWGHKAIPMVALT